MSAADNARCVIKNFWLWLMIIVGLFGALLLVTVSKQIEGLMGGMINSESGTTRTKATQSRP